MTPTEACEKLTSDDVLCVNVAAQATGAVLCGIKSDGLKVLPDDGESPDPFFVSIVEDGGLSHLENIQNGIGLINDPQATNGTSNWTIISLLKGSVTKLFEIADSLVASIASLATIITNTGTTASNTGAIATDIDSINNKLTSLGQKAMTGSVPVVIASDQSAVQSIDAGPSWTTRRGINANGEPFSSADQSGSAAAVTLTPVSGANKLIITDLIVSVGTTMTVTLTEETSGFVIAKLHLVANSAVQVTARGEIKLTTANKRLMVQTSVAGNIDVQALYYEEA